MMWVLVATSILALLRCTSGAALPGATSPTSVATTLVHAGHHADIALTDQGIQLTRVKKQINGDTTPVLFQYNTNTPSSEGLRERRQLQQTSNAIGQPTVQFFRNAGNFNREIQRLFDSIQGQTATGSVGGNTALGGESPRQAAADSSNANVAGPDAAVTASTSSGNSNAPGNPNSVLGRTITEANELVAFERSNNNKNTGNNQVTLSAQENNELGIPILLPLFSNANRGSNTGITSNNVNLQIEGTFGGEQVVSSNSVDANVNTQNDAVNTASIFKSLTSSTPEGSVVNTGNTGIRLVDTRPQASSAGPLNFITNFPTQSLDTTNLFTNFGNAGTSQGTGEPVVVVVPNGVRSIFGLNNQLSGSTLSSGVNNEQTIALANEGVAAAGIIRLKDLIKNPTGQSPRDIFIDELVKSGISSPLQTTITNSNPNSLIGQSFSNFGGVNTANNEQIQGIVNNQGQSSVAEPAPVQVLESPQPSIGSIRNQLGLTSVQLHPQNIGQINANLPSQGAQFIPNQNFVVIPLHFQNVAPEANKSPVLNADPSDPNGFRAQGFSTIGGTNPPSQTQQSLTGTNNNSPTSQFSSIPINTIQSNFQQQSLTGTNNNSPTSQFSSIPINTIQSNFQQQNQFGTPLGQLPRVNNQGNNQLGTQLGQLPRVNTQGNNQLIPLPFATRGPAQVGFFSDRFCTPIHKCKIISNFGTFIPVRK